MSRQEVFIKGYKIDHAKLEQNHGRRPDDPDNLRFLPLWKKFPLPYKYLGLGREPDGGVVLVMVFEDAFDRESLERIDIPPLGAVYERVFTQGIWVHH